MAFEVNVPTSFPGSLFSPIDDDSEGKKEKAWERGWLMHVRPFLFFFRLGGGGGGCVVFSFLVFHESTKKGEMDNYLALKPKP